MTARTVLVSDLDSTLLGDDAALADFAAWCADRRDQLCLVYNSGRLFESLSEAVASTDLPEPDFCIGGVGTDVRDWRTGELLPVWGRPKGWDPGLVRKILGGMGELEPQPDEFQTAYKVSWYAENVPDEFLTDVERTLSAAGCRVELVYSSGRDLDVLPAGVNKGTAARRLLEHTGLTDRDVIVSGDSGNDLAMFACGFAGVVVANARPELKALTGPLVYHARGGYAAGVLEGLRYWQQRQPAVRAPARTAAGC